VTQATTATIEKVVRKVLKQEQDADEKATLKAIQRVSRLLTDQVIPKLDDPQEDEDTGADSDADSDADSSQARGRSFAAAATPDDGPGIPEGEDGETPPEIPEAVNHAFEELYSTLSQERATALAAFFTAISQELGGDEGADDENADTDDEDADNADDDAESHAGSL
jgi:hypothetical protein